MTTDTEIEGSAHLGPSDSIVEETNQDLAKRSSEQLISLLRLDKIDPTSLSNEEIADLIRASNISIRKLENHLANARQCVEIRRLYYTKELDSPKLNEYQLPDDSTDDDKPQRRIYKPNPAILNDSPDKEFDYQRVVRACCENVVGCVRIPVGIAGPLILDGNKFVVPMATTEGCLIASTSRGLSALAKCGGVISNITKDCITRAPVVTFRDKQLRDAIANVRKAEEWLKEGETRVRLQKAFRSNSKHTELIDYTMCSSGRDLHIRFEARTGDAMGMNMCSKGAELALKEMQRKFPTMQILTLSGNMCTDKKPSAINLIKGRGKSVETSASLTPEVVKEVLKVDVDSLCQVWKKKVMIGSAMAGSIGGQNCHAANIVSAIFTATGQDIAQVVSSSNCLLVLDKDVDGCLEVHCSMKSIECGTVGGGTILPDQAGYLALMGINGSSPENLASNYESNACALARIICATVMAGELSLLASLTEGTLVKSHLTHNRSAQPCHLV